MTEKKKKKNVLLKRIRIKQELSNIHKHLFNKLKFWNK